MLSQGYWLDRRVCWQCCCVEASGGGSCTNATRATAVHRAHTTGHKQHGTAGQGQTNTCKRAAGSMWRLPSKAKHSDTMLRDACCCSGKPQDCMPPSECAPLTCTRYLHRCDCECVGPTSGEALGGVAGPGVLRVSHFHSAGIGTATVALHRKWQQQDLWVRKAMLTTAGAAGVVLCSPRVPQSDSCGS